nr:hypothetical transcript [Hymenolepis microstoma]
MTQLPSLAPVIDFAKRIIGTKFISELSTPLGPTHNAVQLSSRPFLADKLTLIIRILFPVRLDNYPCLTKTISDQIRQYRPATK